MTDTDLDIVKAFSGRSFRPGTQTNKSLWERMPSMIRKEVKLGFAIGGVVLAVVVVWVLSVGGSSDHAKKQNASAGAKTSDVASAKSITPSNDSLNNAKPPLDQNAVAAEPVAKADEAKTTEAQPTTAPSEAVASSSSNEPKKSSGDLDWGKLLNSDQPIPLSASNAQQTNTQASSPSPAVSTGDPDAPAPVSPAPQAPPAPQAQPAAATDLPAAAPAAPTAQPVAQTPVQNTQIAAAIPSPQSPAPAAAPAVMQSVSEAEPISDPVSATVAAPATQPARGARSHVVQKNETLSSIAAAAYGNANYYPHILRANPNLDPKRLKPGMSIVLPDVSDVKPHDVPGGSETAHPAATPAAAHTAATLDPTREYRVEARDSLQKISIKLYGKSDQWQKIYELNKDKIGADPAKVKQGMVLKLPAPPTVKVAKQG